MPQSVWSDRQPRAPDGVRGDSLEGSHERGLPLGPRQPLELAARRAEPADQAKAQLQSCRAAALSSPSALPAPSALSSPSALFRCHRAAPLARARASAANSAGGSGGGGSASSGRRLCCCCSSSRHCVRARVEGGDGGAVGLSPRPSPRPIGVGRSRVGGGEGDHNRLGERQSSVPPARCVRRNRSQVPAHMQRHRLRAYEFMSERVR